LDNLGLGEFFFLALLALVFFGPERLPGIGARIGRWIRSLTSYSSAFLNEWRDEALAVHDAVEQVKGIRDEIVAARTEIASTLDTARSDASEAVASATHEVRQQVQRSTQFVPDDGESQAVEQSETARGPAELDARGPAEQGEDVAIAKTQEILDTLVSKRTPPSTVHRIQPTASPVPLDHPRSTVDRPQSTVPPHISPADVEQLRDEVTAIQEEMDELRQEIARFRAVAETAAATEQTREPETQPVPIGEAG
jgi:Sec-independent protein translocase protein TatA